MLHAIIIIELKNPFMHVKLPQSCFVEGNSTSNKYQIKDIF